MTLVAAHEQAWAEVYARDLKGLHREMWLNVDTHWEQITFIGHKKKGRVVVRTHGRRPAVPGDAVDHGENHQFEGGDVLILSRDPKVRA